MINLLKQPNGLACNDVAEDFAFVDEGHEKGGEFEV